MFCGRTCLEALGVGDESCKRLNSMGNNWVTNVNSLGFILILMLKILFPIIQELKTTFFKQVNLVVSVKEEEVVLKTRLLQLSLNLKIEVKEKTATKS